VGLPGVPSPADHTDVFVLQLHPYASVHLGPEGMLGGEARDRVAGFWSAVGRTPPDEPDHLSALLGLYASLADGEAELSGAEARLARRARAALLHEHLAPWLPFLLERVAESGSPFYGPWAELLARVVEGELATAPPPEAMPIHLRDAPELPDPRVEGAGAFLAGLLAPVRAGFIVTRADVARVGGRLGLGVRLGERRRMLEQLLGQEPASVLEALATEAEDRSGRHAARAASLGPSAGFWAGRACTTATLLRDLAADHTADHTAGHKAGHTAGHTAGGRADTDAAAGEGA
jgi:hypothetical protein